LEDKGIDKRAQFLPKANLAACFVPLIIYKVWHINPASLECGIATFKNRMEQESE